MCTVSRISVQSWIAGTKKPGPANREKLHAGYRINPKWWDEDPVAAKAVEAPALTTHELAERIRVEASRMIVDLTTDRERTVVERGRILERVAGVVERLAKMTDGRKLVSSAEWQQMRGKLVEVLGKFPDALEAVLQALDAAEDE